MKDIRKLFGTDGIRGIANIDLTPELVLKIGKAGAKFLSSGSSKKQVIIGRDTRPSGDFISSAIISGVLSQGVDVFNAGIMPTPGVALLIKMLEADGGIVISASHNPVEDNGIKFFAKNGKKLSDKQEKAIEDYVLEHAADSAIEATPENSVPTGTSIGRCTNIDNPYVLYIDYLNHKFTTDLSGLKIAIDCANGAASNLAPLVFGHFGADVKAFNCDIKGFDINRGCGATHPEFISKKTVETSSDIGFAFDGDADRVIACDSRGRIIDGDIMIGFCAIDMSARGVLKNNCVVTTVMANMGFDKALSSRGITIYKTGVGDRYVLEKMIETGCVLGGEQSGHIIFMDISPTGDGIISALEFLNVLVTDDYNIDEIYSVIPKFPQVLKNIKISDKERILSSENIQAVIDAVSAGLGSKGRLLVRPSGTEPLIRVMAEAETQKSAEDAVQTVIDAILAED